MELREQLQSSLGTAYTLDRELGGGGMSRVFVADETALGRKVVVKVLRPDLAEGLSSDRFRREILLAAQLQQANIVPVLSAGTMGDGLPFYTMPLVDGESLRARLHRDGPLPVAEVVRIVEDVAKALAHAHARGVVHRDIKPDNVLLSGGTAVVTDFGIAKAISAARTEAPNATLTTVGTSIGTPAYMAPEQVAGDPDVDHRADLYALGVLAYELLAGTPPFAGMAPHKLLAAHMAATPAAVTEHRPDCPAALATLVMRLLAKDPEARPPSATEVAQALAGIAATPSGGHDALPAISRATRRMLRRALALYAGAVVAVALLARAAVVAIGLPDWVFPAALVVMALGLPAILLTAFVHHGARVARTTQNASATMARLAVKASPHVSWRRTAWAGVLVLVAFVALVAGYMTLRALGIGPAGSLFAKGVLAEQERLLVTDFRGPAADSALGAVLSEGLRTKIGESRVVSVVPASVVADALRRMQAPPGGRLDLATARQLAEREGIRAVVDGSVTPIGGGYVLTARLVAASTGDELTSVQTTADAKEFVRGIDRLGRELRAKMGESLTSVRADPPLERVTTSSLEALKRYTEASRVVRGGGDWEQSSRLLREAVAIDTTFATAYRLLAATLASVRGSTAAERRVYIQKAYQYRDRLPEPERLAAVAYRFLTTTSGDRDLVRSFATYDTLLERYPPSWDALNLYGVALATVGRYAKAESVYRRAVRLDPHSELTRSNLVVALIALGRQREARAMLDSMAREFPAPSTTTWYQGYALWQEGKFDSVGLRATELLTSPSRQLRANGRLMLGAVALTRGRVHEATGQFAQANALDAAGGRFTSQLVDSLDAVQRDVWLLDRPTDALRRLDASLRAVPLSSLPLVRRPYLRVASLYAAAGRPDRARAVLAQHDAEMTDPSQRWIDGTMRHSVLGYIALAEGRPRDAVAEFHRLGRTPDGYPIPCPACVEPDLARAFDRAGMRDSAIAAFEHYLRTPYAFRMQADMWNLAWATKRLGELYEERGDRAAAASQYAQFAALWNDADPELQLTVREVRARRARRARWGGVEAARR